MCVIESQTLQDMKQTLRKILQILPDVQKIITYLALFSSCSQPKPNTLICHYDTAL